MQVYGVGQQLLQQLLRQLRRRRDAERAKHGGEGVVLIPRHAPHLRVEVQAVPGQRRERVASRRGGGELDLVVRLVQVGQQVEDRHGADSVIRPTEHACPSEVDAGEVP